MRILLIVLFALIMAVGGDWAAWSMLTNRLQNAYVGWTNAMRAQGWHVSSDTPVRAGFPFAATLSLPDMHIAGGDSAIPAGVEWRADQVDLGLSLVHPRRLQISPQGQETLRISRSPDIAFTADRIAAWMPLQRLGPGDTAHLELVAESVFGGIVGSHHPRDVQVGKLDLHLDVTRAGAGRTSAQVRLYARSIALPDTGRWPLGATIAGCSAEMGLSSPNLSQPELDDVPDSDAEAAATAWRDGNGKVNIQDFHLKWGPLSLDVQAELGLDDRLQPAGHGTARAGGTSEALDALSRAGTIPAGVADTAKAMLGVMGHATGDALELPFTLKQSKVSVGNIPLTNVRIVDWGRV